MKKLLLFILFPFLIFSQETNEEWHQVYLDKVKLYREDFYQNEKIEKIISAIKELRPTYNKIIEMDQPSINIEKAIVKDYASKYSDLFYRDNQKKENFLRVGVGKNSYDDYLSTLENFLELKAIMAINDLYIQYDESRNAIINQNLKKLNITRKEFDSMSEKDQQILINTFKQ